MAKTYMFDLDGTLVNSVSNIKNALSKFIESNGSVLTEELFKILIPMGYDRSAEYLINLLGLKLSVKEVVKILYAYLLSEYATSIYFKPYAVDFLQGLKEKGARLVVFSQSPRMFIEACFKNNGVTELFDSIICADEFGTDKSNPELFKKVLELLGVDVSDVTYFEDSLVAINTAVNLGFNVYAVKDIQDEETFRQIQSLTSKIVYDYKDLI